ncbi:hypothetical protein BOX37_26815 [Nocardia mangyaensis]|uniref:HTH merR-type domain-containing protein n=1 Tax=Nocardia mangyaensis TaxID=2213200 RepID=A0A1J0VY13_9NOCA|nr:MerR family transcriptional regulator [Nocardia mangyaensis]APE36947.1 hypothetical protein BOX37_26815 [Nocardia mangyaensis]
MTTESEFTIDALARAAHTTVRSVRVYHERGLLPAPQIRGRIGYYRPEHLVRLQTISQLLRKGMKMTGIKELLDAWDRGEGLDEVLQVRGTAATNGVTDRRSTDSGAQLTDALQQLLSPSGPEPGTTPLRVTHPKLYALAARLIGTGLPADEVLRPLIRLHADCSRVATRQAEIIHRLTEPQPTQSDGTEKDRSEQAPNSAEQLTSAAIEELITRSLRELPPGEERPDRGTLDMDGR